MAKTALISGITGQDGSFLTELLLEKGYDVYGIIRRSSSFNTDRIDHLYQDPHEKGTRLRLLYGDLNDSSSLNTILRQVQPDEIYNLGAQSHVRVSFDIPEYTAEVTGLGTVRFLEAIREAGIRPKFYQASSSELYGKVVETPQTEKTPFHPRSPYGCAKAYAYYITMNYREAYGLFADRFVDPAAVTSSVDEQVKAGWHRSLAEGLETAEREGKPVLIDMWATWCKNCLTMDKTTLTNGSVQSALSGYVKIKFQAEDPDSQPAKSVMQKFDAVGLPTYVILRPR